MTKSIKTVKEWFVDPDAVEQFLREKGFDGFQLLMDAIEDGRRRRVRFPGMLIAGTWMIADGYCQKVIWNPGSKPKHSSIPFVVPLEKMHPFFGVYSRIPLDSHLSGEHTIPSVENCLCSVCGRPLRLDDYPEEICEPCQKAKRDQEDREALDKEHNALKEIQGTLESFFKEAGFESIVFEASCAPSDEWHRGYNPCIEATTEAGKIRLWVSYGNEYVIWALPDEAKGWSERFGYNGFGYEFYPEYLNYAASLYDTATVDRYTNPVYLVARDEKFAVKILQRIRELRLGLSVQ